MLSPKRTKFRKEQKGRMKGRATSGDTIAFGEYGLQALEKCWITARQIEAARIAMSRTIKRGGHIWIRIFPNKPVTRHPAEARMGKGKGAVEFWAAVVLPGRIMFEMDGVDRDLAIKALREASQKLPIKVKIVEASEI
ncbi:LSU ribosomal protein L16P [Fibrobacter intestinalis]|uniref:Large ribosomal subunit protein uL16 n=1 Tax=Fibrobacter intestinalis TaxID=28122 RepID=A0A1M6X3P4_9BACT|nr:MULTISPECIES: 50S ribosomal protein L16 [Fibrobacter]MDD7298692.1 50S ribosomal protein L16 [Fibrobacter intestinalis]PBC69388.1 LSU ribosomal protein L16P [Fibrobacter sp. UWS1]PBC74604.1 LSU ribosomal protein L16P [Fibrobacter sp. NR9]SHL00415.1 LSU ribosomal protein L16P [Fibrobacter intestinalis]SJZ91760.1 LSU ribosomal protein L16P [Fibrobacter intestinalis]